MPKGEGSGKGHSNTQSTSRSGPSLMTKFMSLRTVIVAVIGMLFIFCICAIIAIHNISNETETVQLLEEQLAEMEYRYTVIQKLVAEEKREQRDALSVHSPQTKHPLKPSNSPTALTNKPTALPRRPELKPVEPMKTQTPPPPKGDSVATPTKPNVPTETPRGTPVVYPKPISFQSSNKGNVPAVLVVGGTGKRSRS
jgi:hypothetical protein